jgi:hypothetical protein
VPFTDEREANRSTSVPAGKLQLVSWSRRAQIVVLQDAPIAGRKKLGFNDGTGLGRSKQNVDIGKSPEIFASSTEERTCGGDSKMVESIMLVSICFRATETDIQNRPQYMVSQSQSLKASVIVQQKSMAMSKVGADTQRVNLTKKYAVHSSAFSRIQQCFSPRIGKYTLQRLQSCSNYHSQRHSLTKMPKNLAFDLVRTCRD